MKLIALIMKMMAKKVKTLSNKNAANPMLNHVANSDAVSKIELPSSSSATAAGSSPSAAVAGSSPPAGASPSVAAAGASPSVVGSAAAGSSSCCTSGWSLDFYVNPSLVLNFL